MAINLILARKIELLDDNFHSSIISLNSSGNFEIESTTNQLIFNGEQVNGGLMNINGSCILPTGAVVIGNSSGNNETSTSNNLIIDDENSLITMSSQLNCIDIQTQTMTSINNTIIDLTNKLNYWIEINCSGSSGSPNFILNRNGVGVLQGVVIGSNNGDNQITTSNNLIIDDANNLITMSSQLNCVDIKTDTIASLNKTIFTLTNRINHMSEIILNLTGMKS